MPTSPDIHRARFGLVMALISALAALAAAAVAGSLGGPSSALVSGVGIAVGSLVGFVPCLRTIPVDQWGLTVAVCGMARIVAIALVMSMLADADLPRRPLAIAGSIGAAGILVGEAITASVILAGLDRRRTPRGVLAGQEHG